ANVIGECMKLHPHGDASIGDALVVLANKEYFIEKQGNFGNILTGHAAAASRYTECRLTPLAVDMSTTILPHNFIELLRAQVAILRDEEHRLAPDFLQGGMIDISEYDDGRGKI